MPVTVVNRHHLSPADLGKSNYLYLGRPHPLSNSFTVQQYGREEANERYKAWLKSQIRSGEGAAYIALVELCKRHHRGEFMKLGCSCKPADCHVDTIKLAIEWLTPKLYPPPKVGDRVRHIDERVVDRRPIDGKDYNPASISHHPAREGVIVATHESDSWAVCSGMVSVLWDDLTGGVLTLQHPLKHGNQVNIIPQVPSSIPAHLLKVISHV
jgi:hypothetical protein